MTSLGSRIEHVQDHVFEKGETAYVIDPNEFDIYEVKITQIDGDKYTLYSPDYETDEVVIGTSRLLPQTTKNNAEFKRQEVIRLRKEKKLNENNESNSRKNSDSNSDDSDSDDTSDLEDTNSDEKNDIDSSEDNDSDSANINDSDNDNKNKKKKIAKGRRTKKDKKKRSFDVHIEFNGPVSFYVMLSQK